MSADPKLLLPAGKQDIRNAEALVAAGYPAVRPVLPEILEWTQDGNWPVARVLHPFLAGIGADLAPYLRPILCGGDDTWKYFVLNDVVASSPRLASALAPELERLATQATAGEHEEGVDAIAAEILSGLC